MRAERVEPGVTRVLRNSVLRPGQPLDAVHWPGLDDPAAATFAVFDPDAPATPVTTVTVRPEQCPWRPDEPTPWRLRGMATHEAWRGRGVGRIALDAAVDHVRSEGATLVWCHARVVALSFYERAGFVVEGEEFLNDAGIPHRPMARLAVLPIFGK